MTVYKGAKWAGQPKDIAYRDETEEMAFSVHLKTERKEPGAFLRSHTGLGGRLDKSMVTVAAEKKAAIAASIKPPFLSATEKRINPPNSELRRAYERGDLPCIMVSGAKNKLKWRVELNSLGESVCEVLIDDIGSDIGRTLISSFLPTISLSPALFLEMIDFHHYLPLFISGLREVEEPFRFFGEEGSLDLISAGGEAKVLPVISEIILPLKKAFATRDENVIVRSMRVLSALAALGNRVGAALVPYYRQILPALNAFMGTGKNLGDGIDYGQRFGSIGDKITDCLQSLELSGGPDALVNLKYVISSYESALIFN